MNGQSAGASDLWVVASLPQAPNLMSAAILQSGGGTDIGLNATVLKDGASFAKALQCNDVRDLLINIRGHCD